MDFFPFSALSSYASMQKKKKTLLDIFLKYLWVFLFNITRYSLAKLLFIQSIPTALKAPFKRERIWIEREYRGQKLLLIALFQKGTLRPDIRRLLEAAKRAGLYVIGVNNAKIADKGELNGLFDCYIERFNFGRDFGSYQSGMFHLFSRKIHEKADRLILLNDSVFYESTKTAGFLDQLMHTDIEVLGATENHEYERHIGSFCISIAGNILRSPKFMEFWKRYKKSDVRPYVIKRGELALSLCLRRLVSTPEQFRALYDIAALGKLLQSDQKHFDAALRLARKSALYPWPRLVAHEFWPQFLAEHYPGALSAAPSNYSCHSFEAVRAHFQNDLQIKDSDLEVKMERYLLSGIFNVFMRGSQIHHNNPFLLYWGLPIVKLDGVYRGVLIPEDVIALSSQMSKEEGEELQRLLFSKAFGEDALFGLKRQMFRTSCI